MKIFKPAKARLWEIDLLRGIAVVMMIAFHLLYDLNYFAGHSFVLSAGFWWLFARFTAVIFLFLVGVSLTLSHSRTRARLSGKEMTMKYARRGLKIFGWGLLITALTWIFLSGKGTIWFGVLHLIGISIILARPLIGRRFLNLLLAFAFTIAGLYLSIMVFDFPWLLPLGFTPAAFYTLDYLPVLPWFGAVLFGLFFGGTFYPGGKRLFPLSTKAPCALKPICFIGRHSLLIYLLHQPVLIGVIYIMFMV